MQVEIRDEKKKFLAGTHRAKVPGETITELEPLMRRIGAVDLVDCTERDRHGIPCFAVIRRRAGPGNLQVHVGRGLDPGEAQVSAMAMAIERFSAEYQGDPMELAAYEAIGIKRAVDPRELIPSRIPGMGEQIHWTRSFDLLNRTEIFVPSNAVYLPYNTLGMAQSLFASDPNGLAAGNTPNEAILYGLLEVLERDALSRAERNHSMGKRLTPGTSSPVQDLLSRYEKAGIAIHLWLVEGLTRIPTVAAAADDLVTKDPALLVMGAAAHPSPEVAATQALIEVAQRRAMHLQGATSAADRQEFIHRIGYERMKRINREWFAPADSVDLSSLPDLSTSTIGGDIRLILNDLSEKADHVCVCDLTRTSMPPIPPMPVVRVVVPGLEVSYINKERVRRR
jgi:ribosomal protein S12 methylthiotransferase accessory factor